MAQKDHERICVERFLEAIGNVPTLIEDSETPDFRVRFGEEVVGIEVTKALHLGKRGKDSSQAQASLATNVMNQARDLYAANGAPPLHVTAAFLSHTPLSGSRVPELSRAVAALRKARQRALCFRYLTEYCVAVPAARSNSARGMSSAKTTPRAASVRLESNKPRRALPGLH
jgi:hypothetical protein